MNLDKIKSLQVVTPQGASGFLSKEARFSFNYTNSEKHVEVSLSMPMRAESYSGGGLFSVFAMNKPEGYLLDSLKNRFGKVAKLDDMSLLKITGKHQIGRLSYIDPNDMVESKKSTVSLNDLVKSTASEELFNYLVDTYFDSGISGFQPKVLVADKSIISPVVDKATAVTPDLIVKSAGDDYPHLAENEFMCMSVAKEAGISVPDFWLSEDNGLFILKRFDIADSGNRLGMEDMCALTNTSADDKYHGSYEGVGRIIASLCGSNSTESLHRYFEYVALSVLVKNGDAHLKNFSLIYEHPSAEVKLSPIYDVVTTSVYQSTNPRTGMNIIDRTMALGMNKSKNYPDNNALCKFGRSICGVSRPQEVIDRIEAAKITVIRDSKGRIDDGFLADMIKVW
ncbi:MAG: type II toxin-antitoxin system HipA family toxin [Methylotenera sp.]|uniref:type II toxin-antitoxin system HipA family toxin n=1 Tax=Methylotenera sp. TaxID=2051956 RepID=UPI0024894E9E|nr:type II toxin-antitoxin system HipA family toxin [Methylotenera sp.]MDI1307909.1 type II toxin-antitoxin system HipA family toxin [Methylotenera sp.]